MSFRCILRMWYAKCDLCQSYFPNGLKKLSSLGAGAQVNKGMPLPGAPKALARSCSCARGVDNRYKYVDCHGSERMNFSFLSFFSLLSVSWLRKPIFGSLKAACSLSANGRTLPRFEVKQACSLLPKMTLKHIQK